MARQPFTRLNVKDPDIQRVVSDLYDKLQVSLTQPRNPSSSSTTTNTTVVVNPGGGGGGGTPSTSQYAIIPKLTAVPSNNPVTGAPYAVDGGVVQVNDQFWRYTGSPTFQWFLTPTATIIETDTHANRVASFPAASYPNALFLESDTLTLLYSDSSSWLTLAGQVEDTHANRLSSWPSVQYSVGTEFYETDRTAVYVVETASGTINTTGTAVAWVSGDHFINTGSGFNSAQWPAGTVMTINSVGYPLASVTNSTTATLASSAGVQAGVSYTVASGRWVYLSGQYSDALASIPTDLGENDENFLFFENAAYYHQLQRTASAWQRGPADLEHSDTFHEFGEAPTDGGWHECDGSTGVTYLKYTGTTGTRDLPDLSGTPAYAQGGNTYSATITAAAAPKVTPTGTVSQPTFTGVAAPLVNVTLGSGSPNVVGPTYTPSGTVSQPTFTGNLNTTTLPGDPIDNFPVIKYYRK